MGLFKRIQDIISANLNDMVEGFEDPEQMLRQAVREMEEAIGQAKPEVARAMAQEKTVRKELSENESQAQTWSQRAETAVAAGDDGLACKALVRKKECEKIVAALRDEHEAAAEASQTLRRQLEAMQAKLADAERILGTLVARKRAADVRARVAGAKLGGEAELGQKAFDKFDRLSRKVAQAEAEVEALAELAQAEASLASGESLDAPSENDDIEAELLALKSKPRAR
jgi:phage shock protein A